MNNIINTSFEPNKKSLESYVASFEIFGEELDLIVTVIQNEYTRYVSRKHGEVDIFTFIAMKMRTVRMNGMHEEAVRYGFSGLKIYEGELQKAYDYISQNNDISGDERKKLVSLVTSRITLRRIEWLILMGECQVEVVNFFDYWEQKFLQHPSLLGETNPVETSEEKTSADVISDEMEEIYRILDGLPEKNSPASL